jgi:hypothetical protein
MSILYWSSPLHYMSNYDKIETFCNCVTKKSAAHLGISAFGHGIHDVHFYYGKLGREVKA